MRENQNKTVALVPWIAEDALLPELYDAAQAVGVDLQIEESVDFHHEYVLLIFYSCKNNIVLLRVYRGVLKILGTTDGSLKDL